MKRKDLFFLMNAVVRRLQREQRDGTAHVYQSTLNRIKAFEGRAVLPFNAINTTWLHALESYLMRQQLSMNTISTYLRMLRSVYNQAVEQGLAPYVPHLFKQVYTGTRVGSSRALTVATMRALMRPAHELPADLERTRSLFVLLFLLRGICFVDIVFLRKCDLRGDVLTYRRHKTGRELTVRVEPQAMRIIRQYANTTPGSPYLFPFIQDADASCYRQYQVALRYFNQQLKRLIPALGLRESLTSYCARHSWATLANFRHYDKEMICNAMGHSSVKVTETYFQSFKEDKINAMNKGIISYVMSYR